MKDIYIYIFCFFLKLTEKNIRRDTIQVIRYSIPLLERLNESNSTNIENKLFYNNYSNISNNSIFKSINTEIAIYIYDFINCLILKKLNSEKLMHHSMTLALMSINKVFINDEIIGGFHAINILNIHSLSDIILRINKRIIDMSKNIYICNIAGGTALLSWIYLRHIVYFRYIGKVKNKVKNLSKLRKDNYPHGAGAVPHAALARICIYILQVLFVLNIFYTIQIAKFLSRSLNPSFLENKNVQAISDSRDFSKLFLSTKKYIK